jgi:hypothetical protein
VEDPAGNHLGLPVVKNGRNMTITAGVVNPQHSSQITIISGILVSEVKVQCCLTMTASAAALPELFYSTPSTTQHYKGTKPGVML